MYGEAALVCCVSPHRHRVPLEAFDDVGSATSQPKRMHGLRDLPGFGYCDLAGATSILAASSFSQKIHHRLWLKTLRSKFQGV